MTKYTSPLKSAALRFARTAFYGAISAVALVAIASLTAFNDTAAALLIPFVTAGLVAADKWARRKGENA